MERRREGDKKKGVRENRELERELESEKESRRGRKGGKERGWEGQMDRASG